MSDELITTVELPFRARVRHGVCHPDNWVQLIRYGVVGTTGYLLNLATFAFCLHVLGIDYRLSSFFAFFVGVVNNFWLNRHWTFSAKEAHPMRQAVKFFAVSGLGYLFTYVVLVALVDGAGTDKVIAQAIGVASSTPLTFLGQKFWSFRA